MQGYNGLKYFSTFTAISLRTAYHLNGGLGWRIAAIISSGITAIISTYWDLVFDWGLLQKHSKNPWLRDKLLVPYKGVYFGAMVRKWNMRYDILLLYLTDHFQDWLMWCAWNIQVLNVLLRLAWLQTVLKFKLPFLHIEALVTIVACLEIIRRGIWNFFRYISTNYNQTRVY